MINNIIVLKNLSNKLISVHPILCLRNSPPPPQPRSPRHKQKESGRIHSSKNKIYLLMFYFPFAEAQIFFLNKFSLKTEIALHRAWSFCVGSKAV